MTDICIVYYDFKLGDLRYQKKSLEHWQQPKSISGLARLFAWKDVVLLADHDDDVSTLLTLDLDSWDRLGSLWREPEHEGDRRIDELSLLGDEQFVLCIGSQQFHVLAFDKFDTLQSQEDS